MSDKRFEVEIIEKFCKGCGLCVAFCPTGKLYMRKEPNRKGVQPAVARDDVDCTGCGQCATMCPDAAIVVRRLQPAGPGRSDTNR